MQKITNKGKALILYSLILFILLILSCFSLFFKAWEPICSIGVAGIFNFLYLYLILYFGADNSGRTSLKKGSNVLLFNILRTLIVFVGIIVIGLLIYFVPSLNSNEFFIKYRLLFILLSLIPYFLSIGIYYFFTKRDEE